MTQISDSLKRISERRRLKKAMAGLEEAEYQLLDLKILSPVTALAEVRSAKYVVEDLLHQEEVRLD